MVHTIDSQTTKQQTQKSNERGSAMRRRRISSGEDPAAVTVAATVTAANSVSLLVSPCKANAGTRQRSTVNRNMRVLCAVVVVITLSFCVSLSASSSSSSSSFLMVDATEVAAAATATATTTTTNGAAAAAAVAEDSEDEEGTEAEAEADQTCTVYGSKTCVASPAASADDVDETNSAEEQTTSSSFQLLTERKQIDRNLYAFDTNGEMDEYLGWMEDDSLGAINDFCMWFEQAGYHRNIDLFVAPVSAYPRNFTFSYDPFFAEDSLVSFIIDTKEKKTDNNTRSPEHPAKLFELSFVWIEKGIDEAFQAMAIYSLLHRLDALQPLMTATELTDMGFSDDEEHRLIQEYFFASLEGLTMAWMYRHHTYDETAWMSVTNEATNTEAEEDQAKVRNKDTQEEEEEDEEEEEEEGRNLPKIYKQDMDETYYDPLTDYVGRGSEDKGSMDLNNCITGTVGEGDGKRIGTAKTAYQTIDYHYEHDVLNTYMHMNSWLHSSNSHRAHYHDGMIHVPLQYVQDVKRVAYIGGGDNMPLYELLKYPNIELIVGMELDQQVTRSSFQYFGTSPNYHDPRVQWWFGDASKTIKALPEDYIGSFDFVIVDLLSFVQDRLRVVADLSILDAAAVLMKNDGGVLSRQDDYCVRSAPTKTMTKRVVEWDWLDMPGLCEASFTAGSNSIDLLHADRYDHGIETLVRLRDFNASSSYDAWTRYYDHTASMRSEQKTYSDIDDGSSTGADKKWDGYNPTKCKTIHDASPESKAVPLTGFLHVIEVEGLTELPWEGDYMKIIRTDVMDLLVESNGLHEKLQLHNPEIDKNHLFVLLEEGYISIHVFPEAMYVAFDVLIWDSPSKSESIKESLIRSVRGNPTQSTSDFRVVTGGLSGLKNRQTHSNGLLEAAETVFCGGVIDDNDSVDESDSDDNGSDKSDKNNGTNQNGDGSESPASLSLPDQSSIIPEIFTGLLPKKQNLTSAFVVAILCGSDESCDEFDNIGSLSSNEDGITFYPVQSCGSFDDMDQCQSIIQADFETIIAHNKRLDGILIGRDVTVDTGRIFHKIFNNTINQEKYFERLYVVASPTVNGEQWRNVLLERFRNELVIAHPLYRTDIELYNDTHKDEWLIASIGDDKFFEHLSSMEASISKNTNLSSITKEVETGAKPVQYDHDPKGLTDNHFYEESIELQWFRQTPVAYQSLIQMDLKRFNAPLKVNDIVLAAAPYNKNSNIGWIDNYGMTDYFKATVKTVSSGHTYGAYGLDMHSQTMSDGRIIQGQSARSYDRSLIRRYSSDDNRKIIPGDFILIPKVYKDNEVGEGSNSRKAKFSNVEEITVAYISGIVLAVLDNEMFSVHYFEPISQEETLMDVPIKSCLLADEIPDLLEVEPLSKPLIEEAFEDALMSVVITEGTVSKIESTVVGDGIVAHAIWPEGNAVMKWDGLERVEINLFLYTENLQMKEVFKTKFMDHFKNLGMAFEDTFPRGYGDVVNFKSDMETYVPHWTSKKFGKRHPSRDPPKEIDYDMPCNEDDDDYDCVEVEVNTADI